MNDKRQHLLTIGAFADAAQLSLKALRLYTQLGILTPSYVDPDSGYRYYHAQQLHRARLIRMLRQIDLPLATIRRVLATSPAEAQQLVQEHCAALEQRAEQARRAVHDLMAFIRQEEPTMALEVTVRTVAPQPIISINKRVKVEQLGEHIRDSLKALYTLVEAQGGSAAGAPLGIYHGPVNHEDDGPIEVCLPVQSAPVPTGDALTRELPAGKIASVIMTGDQCEFPAILKGYDMAFDWVRQHGYEPTEPPREIWHSQPGESARMEIALPFK
ncbi:MAG: MerR family transcriptional regulator [Burkholderiales bacterium]